MVENASATVSIVNTSRRPVVVRCPGQTVRLAAGEQASIDRSWLKTSELRGLCDSGLVSVLETSAQEESAVAAGATAETKQQSQKRSGGRRSRKPRQDEEAAPAARRPEGAGAPAAVPAIPKDEYGKPE